MNAQQDESALSEPELQYLEAAGLRNAAFRLETMELMNKRAHTVATLALGGGGALCAFAIVKVSSPPGFAALIAAGVWLFLVALFAVVKCLHTSDVRPPATEPVKLMGALREWSTYLEASKLDADVPGADSIRIQNVSSLARLREGQLKVLDKTILQYAEINNASAANLNNAYLLAVATPVIAGLTAWITATLCHCA